MHNCINILKTHGKWIKENIRFLTFLKEAMFMKSYKKELWFQTKNRREFINITGEIISCLAES